MYDRNTDSLWSQLIGEAIEGPLKGAKLETVPLVLTTWQDWKSNFPETIALKKGTSSSRDPYERYFADNSAGVIGEEIADNRLARKELVIGSVVNGNAIAYPSSVLTKELLINDTFNGKSILVVFNANSNTAQLFERVVNGELLDFSLTKENDKTLLKDEQTGSLWLPLTGQAVQGELQGTILKRIHSVNVFWFAWTDFYPDTTLYKVAN